MKLSQISGYAEFCKLYSIEKDGCFEWSGSVNRQGYGRVYVAETGGRMGAHRLAWELANGKIPEGLYVCHHCDNPPCVRIDHLFLGTQEDNIRDASNKKRMKGNRVPRSAEQRARISLAQRGRKRSLESIKAGAEKIRGKKRPPHVGIAVARANALRIHSDVARGKYRINAEKRARDTKGRFT